jgi:hypothetical protein
MMRYGDYVVQGHRLYHLKTRQWTELHVSVGNDWYQTVMIDHQNQKGLAFCNHDDQGPEAVYEFDLDPSVANDTKLTVEQRSKLGMFSALPIQVLDLILVKLDAKSLSRLAQSCCGFKRCTANEELWKQLCISKNTNMLQFNSWRQTYQRWWGHPGPLDFASASKKNPPSLFGKLKSLIFKPPKKIHRKYAVIGTGSAGTTTWV